MNPRELNTHFDLFGHGAVIAREQFDEELVTKATKHYHANIQRKNPWQQFPKFCMEGNPVQRAAARFNHQTGGKQPYDPSKSANWKLAVADHVRRHLPHGFVPASGPVIMAISFYKKTPKSLKPDHLKYLAEIGIVQPVSKPDLSNYIKNLEDALKGILWNDDSQVVGHITFKYFSLKPRVEFQALVKMQKDHK